MVTRVTVIGRPFWRYLKSGRPKPETALFQIGYPSSQREGPDRAIPYTGRVCPQPIRNTRARLVTLSNGLESVTRRGAGGESVT